MFSLMRASFLVMVKMKLIILLVAFEIIFNNRKVALANYGLVLKVGHKLVVDFVAETYDVLSSVTCFRIMLDFLKSLPCPFQKVARIGPIATFAILHIYRCYNYARKQLMVVDNKGFVEIV